MSSKYLLFLLIMGAVSSLEVQRPRGVPLSKAQFYEENELFTCLDGSRSISFDRVNDDYCDCRDGSDEPGTAACPNGSFHCANVGFRPAVIPSSRVNDGICDCCDTTDEYNSKASCQNTCKELGRKELQLLQKKAHIAKQGLLLKQQLIIKAKEGQEEKKSKLKVLQANRKHTEEKAKALSAAKETAEQVEKEAKDQHLKAWEEQKVLIQMGKDKARMAKAFLELDDNADDFVSVPELLSHIKLDPNSDSTLKEGRGLLGGFDRVDIAGFETVWGSLKENVLVLRYLTFDAVLPAAPVEAQANNLVPSVTQADSQEDGKALTELLQEEAKETVSNDDSKPYPKDDIPLDEDDDNDDDDNDEESWEPEADPPLDEQDDTGNYNDDDDDDEEEEPWEPEADPPLDEQDDTKDYDEDDEEEDDDEEEIPPPTQTHEKKDDEAIPPYKEDTQKLIDAAQKARREFELAERALGELVDQIGTLEKELSLDFGPSAEFSYLYSQCYEFSSSEYIYRFCPFSHVSQKPKYGRSDTNIGSWGSWSGPDGDVYSVMKYDHGTQCSQGPNRSTTVKLTCGIETVLMSTSEPSPCEYLMEFVTPAACHKQSMDSMLNMHDEL